MNPCSGRISSKKGRCQYPFTNSMWAKQVAHLSSASSSMVCIVQAIFVVSALIRRRSNVSLNSASLFLVRGLGRFLIDCSYIAVLSQNFQAAPHIVRWILLCLALSCRLLATTGFSPWEISARIGSKYSGRFAPSLMRVTSLNSESSSFKLFKNLLLTSHLRLVCLRDCALATDMVFFWSCRHYGEICHS